MHRASVLRIVLLRRPRMVVARARAVGMKALGGGRMDVG